MSQNSLSKDIHPTPKSGGMRRIVKIAILPAWVFIGFSASEIIVELLVQALNTAGVPLASIQPALFSSIDAVVVYALTILIVIGGPWFALKRKTKREELGLGRLPEWFDFLMAPAGFVVYFILSALFLVLANHLFPGFSGGQAQDTGFSQLNRSYQFVLAFLTLVVIAPFSEELIFRGYLLGKLRAKVPLWAAVLITSVLFGLLHVPGGGWSVAVDVFALSITLCLLRVYTGSIWASILLHMIKNAIAYYILFINPTLFSTLGT
jgi:membrane protease YdiL (CAAX protease family)